MSKIYPPKSSKIELEYAKISFVFFTDWRPGIELGFWDCIRKNRMDVGVLCMEKSRGDNRKENVKLYPWLFSAVSRNIALNEGWVKKGYIPTSFWWPLFNDKKTSEWFKNLSVLDKETVFKAIALEGLLFNKKIKCQFLEEKISNLPVFFDLLKEEKENVFGWLSKEERNKKDKSLEILFSKKNIEDEDKELFKVNVEMANQWKEMLGVFFNNKKAFSSLGNSMKKLPALFENFIFSNVQWALGEDDVLPKMWIKNNFCADIEFENGEEWMKNEGFMIAKVPDFSVLFKDVDVLYGDAFEVHLSNNTSDQSRAASRYFFSSTTEKAEKEKAKIDLFNKIEKLKTNPIFPSPIESWWKKQLENVFLLGVECDKKSEISKFVVENKKTMNEDLVFYYFTLCLFKNNKNSDFKHAIDLFLTFDFGSGWEKKMRSVFSEDTFFNSIEKFNKLMLKKEVEKESRKKFLENGKEQEKAKEDQGVKIKSVAQRF